MLPGTAMLIGSGISAGADLIGGASARSQAKEQAQQQMDFQERMSSTAYQRATKDMEAAGLNPALMYGSGGPESSPGGSSAPIENILGDAGKQLASSAADSQRLNKEMSETDSRTELNKTLKKKAEADTASALVHARAEEGRSALDRHLGEILDRLPNSYGLWDKLKESLKSSSSYSFFGTNKEK